MSSLLRLSTPSPLLPSSMLLLDTIAISTASSLFTATNTQEDDNPTPLLLILEGTTRSVGSVWSANWSYTSRVPPDPTVLEMHQAATYLDQPTQPAYPHYQTLESSKNLKQPDALSVRAPHYSPRDWPPTVCARELLEPPQLTVVG
nr:hypothetical protein Itr_chr06CG12800 [Ipomoea trifida]